MKSDEARVYLSASFHVFNVPSNQLVHKKGSINVFWND